MMTCCVVDCSQKNPCLVSLNNAGTYFAKNNAGHTCSWDSH